MRSTLAMFTKQTMGRVRRLTSTKQRSMMLVVRSLRHRCREKLKKDNNSGSVVLNVTVSDRNGKVLWQGTAWGSNQTFGRSYHLDNYQQVLSDSLVDAANNLLKSQALREALTLSD